MNNMFYDIPVDWYKEFDNTFNVKDNLNNTLNINQTNLASPKEGFLRGNLFNNLYDPYKNYKYRELTPTNKREELLFNILKFKFALTELNLYLDLHPMDSEMIGLYNKYLMEMKKLWDEYEKSFGPLTIDSVNMSGNNWKWIDQPWPWEGTR